MSRISIFSVEEKPKEEIFFDPEEKGDMFLRNVRLSPNYTALHPRRQLPP
jgi:hypothetical protein